MRLATFLKRHSLWVGFAAVLLPLAVLLAVQYRWLVELGAKSRAAHEASLATCLDTVAKEVQYIYKDGAWEALSVHPAAFTHGRLDKIAYHFHKKAPQGASPLFVVTFDGEHGKERFWVYDESRRELVRPEWTEVMSAVFAATSPLRVFAHKGGTVEDTLQGAKLGGHRLLFYPIADDASRLVGITGMVLDPAYFRERLLPRVIGEVVPKFAGSYGSRDDLVVMVHDETGKVALTWPPDPSLAKKGLPCCEVGRTFSMVFTDWKIGLSSRRNSPAHLARRSFVLNVALAAILSGALLAGIALILRTASREMKLSQMKSDFVSNVSHELRTPLASIRVFGEFLRLGRFEGQEKAREYGEYIETESRRLTQLINNLLDFASIESGRKSYRFERADVAEVVADTLKTFEVRLRQSGFRILYAGPQGPLPPVQLDPGAITQALSNLLDNAVKYSNGGREILVSLNRQAGTVVLAVEDQGIGIPRDEQKKIFDRFHRVSTGLVHDVKGSGLGLAIVRHIVEAHGGWVSVESRPGEGSTFSIHLPIERTPDEAPAPGAGPGTIEARTSEA
jgi:signal transduction histidine kinase